MGFSVLGFWEFAQFVVFVIIHVWMFWGLELGRRLIWMSVYCMAWNCFRNSCMFFLYGLDAD
jgi:hypothetical protein